MIEWLFSHLIEQAKAKADAVPALKGSMRRHDANDVGALGEVIATDYLTACGLQVSDVSSTSYVYDLHTTAGRFEVKTKERKVRPMLTYECSIADSQRDHDRPDWYLFVSIRSDDSEGWGRFRQAWVLGTMEAERFWSSAQLWKPGMRGDNGWKPTIPCWNVQVSDLRRPKQVVQPRRFGVGR